MANVSVRLSFSLIACAIILAIPSTGPAQAPVPGGQAPEPLGTNAALDGPWEFTFDGRLGVPTGRLKVGEFPTGSLKAGGGGAPGTLFRLRDLGIHVSEALEGSVAFHFTPRDAVRASYLYYFLRAAPR